MFRIGEKRNPLKLVPGIIRLSVLKSESTARLQPEHEEKFPYSYSVIKFTGHDPFKTEISPKRPLHDKNGDEMPPTEVVWRQEHEDYETRLDVPKFGYDAPIAIELWDCTESSKSRFEDGIRASHLQSNDDVPNFVPSVNDPEDVQIGSVKIPLLWILNAYGGGYCVAGDAPGIFRFRMDCSPTYPNPVRALGGRLIAPYDIEVKFVYNVEDHSEQAVTRFTSMKFAGTYQLNHDRSLDMEEFYQATRVPWALRKMEEVRSEEKLAVQVMKGGSEISFARSNIFYQEVPEALKIDSQFQSVKTYRGTIQETRLYWDTSNMPLASLKNKNEAYPSPILMRVTRLGSDIGDMVEAWDLSGDGNTLTQLIMVTDLAPKFKRVYVRIPENEDSKLPKPPKLVVRDGTLTVVVIAAHDLVPPADDADPSPVPCHALAVLKLLQFGNKDIRYADPINAPVEEQTRVFEDDDRNPQWNQIFHFSVKAMPNTHYALILEMWNKEKENEEAHIGLLRIPLPWIYNSYASEMGPLVISSYQVTFKLRSGDRLLDPTAKAKYGGGRVSLKISYQPS